MAIACWQIYSIAGSHVFCFHVLADLIIYVAFHVMNDARQMKFGRLVLPLTFTQWANPKAVESFCIFKL